MPEDVKVNIIHLIVVISWTVFQLIMQKVKQQAPNIYIHVLNNIWHHISRSFFLISITAARHGSPRHGSSRHGSSDAVCCYAETLQLHLVTTWRRSWKQLVQLVALTTQWQRNNLVSNMVIFNFYTTRVLSYFCSLISLNRNIS